MNQGYMLNVARLNDRTGRYEHFCRVDCGDHYQQSVIVARDVAARFPAITFKCELTRWQAVGRSVNIDTGQLDIE